jgi:hypothetical protein
MHQVGCYKELHIMNTVLFWGIAKQKLKSLVLVIKKGR